VRERWRDTVALVVFLAQCALIILGIYLIGFGLPLVLLMLLAAVVQLVW
jgi:hypothetical protein